MSRLGPGDVACWLIKTAVPPDRLAPRWAPGEDRVLDRCVRPSYRLDLMVPGRPCVLWLSGRDRPGVHAIGTVAGEVVEGSGGPTVPLRLRLLAGPLARAALLQDATFSGAEVVRMPAGSNPSWLSHDQFAAVLSRIAATGLGP